MAFFVELSLKEGYKTLLHVYINTNLIFRIQGCVKYTISAEMNKGGVALPNRMNFRENFKWPSFSENYIAFFRKTSEKALYKSP